MRYYNKRLYNRVDVGASRFAQWTTDSITKEFMAYIILLDLSAGRNT